MTTNDPAGPAELARLRAEAAEAAAAAAQAKADALAARLAAAEAGAGADSSAPTVGAPTAGTGPASGTGVMVGTSPAPDARTLPTDLAGEGSGEPRGDVPGNDAADLEGYAATVAQGYPTAGVLPLGVLTVDGAAEPRARVGLPLRTLNRHALVTGATGTGKTRTLQLMAEGLSDAGVPVFLTDIKGDVTGLVAPGAATDKLTERTQALGQEWSPAAYPAEFLTLGGAGTGVPIRTTITDFGPLLLAKVLGLNETQESSLALVFHWADSQGLALLDLKDLRALLTFLTGEGKAELKAIGGVSSATAGVILRELGALEAQGGADFFGEPAFATADLLRTAPDGRGVISSLQLPSLQDRPALFSTFVMWLLAELFDDLPEVGDRDAPALVFFFDEAHLLFADASKEFLAQVVRTVRLIRSKGVGIVFVTQSATDLPTDVLAQLGARVQHAVRAHTPADADDLRKVARTFPTSPFDLTELLPALGTGEAVVTVLSESGAPTPVAPTRLWTPRSDMGPASPADVEATVAASPLREFYAEAIDRESAYELLARRGDQARDGESREGGNAREDDGSRGAGGAPDDRFDDEQRERDRELRELQERLDREGRESERSRTPRSRSRTSGRRSAPSGGLGDNEFVDSMIRSAGRTLGREITRSLFGTRRR